METAHKPSPIARWKLALVMAAFFASWFIVKPIWHLLDLHGPAERAIPLAIPALATFAFVRSMMAISPGNPALRRYGNGLLPCLLGYLALLILANLVANALPADWAVSLIIQIVPVIPMLAFLWVIARYLTEEPDEYQRMLAVRCALVGSGLLLAVAMTWGPLQRAGIVGPAQTGLGFVIWCAGFGISRLFWYYK